MGYWLAEDQGRHHRMFVDARRCQQLAISRILASLNRGDYQAAEYKRVGKGGREVWILASYNPILNESGKPFKVVKFATDIHRTKAQGGGR